MKSLLEILVAILLLATIAWVVAAVSEYGCASRWSQSGLVTSWGLSQGCLVGPPGKLVPERNYREMP